MAAVLPWVRALPFTSRVAAAVLATLALSAVAAPWWAPYDPNAAIPAGSIPLDAPSATHWLGTDAAARDLLSRLMHGTRVSLATALLAGMIVLVVGAAWGGIAGMASDRVDRWMMRLVDAMLATPRLLIVLAVVAFTERLPVSGLALLLGLTAWPMTSRLVRARVRELRATDYVAAARALGTPEPQLLTRHILPGALPVALVGAVVAMASVIPLEAGLSFVGAGVAPPNASWGVLLYDGSVRPLDAWWLLLFPSVAIAATVMSVSVLADHLQRRVRTAA